MPRIDTLAVVYHWTAAPGQENDTTARYFEMLAQQDDTDDKGDRYASAHAIIGIDGEILQVIPWHEVAYHVGAKTYTGYAQHKFKGYTRNTWHSTPNWCTIGIELCHPDKTGVFTWETLHSAEWLGWWLLRKYILGINDICRHYDITGKLCPKWFVENKAEFYRFKGRIDAYNMLEE